MEQRKTRRVYLEPYTTDYIIGCISLIDDCEGYDEYIIEKLEDWLHPNYYSGYYDFDIVYGIIEVQRIKIEFYKELRRRKLKKLNEISE